jgi:hypothetical protein
MKVGKWQKDSRKWKEPKMAKTTFSPADEVKQIAEELIPKYHSHLDECKVRIDYVFISKTPSSGGKDVWGTCRKITNLNAHLAGEEEPFFVITISEPVWSVLPDQERRILVDHELCHAWAEFDDDEDNPDAVKLSIREHDMEEFSAIVRRYGAWRDEIKDFVDNAMKSKELHS